MKPVKVLKFGTTAIANSDKLKLVTQLVANAPQSIIILSAFAGTTNMLEEISDYLYKKNPESANEVLNRLEKEYINKVEGLYTKPDIKKKALDLILEKVSYIRSFTKDLFTLFEERIVLAQGEILSSGLFILMLKEHEVNVIELSALDFMRIDKKSEPDNAYIQKKLNQLLEENSSADIYVTQGYICRNAYNEIDNFHFGGSDYTASLVGAAIQANEIQIWTDIDRMYTNDSQLISNSQTVHHINFDEAAELSYFGAKILHPMCILPAKMSNIPVRLLNIYNPQAQGTTISNETEKGKIKAIASKEGITAINIKSSRMLFAHGFLRKICEVFEQYETSIDMLTTSEVGVSITIDNEKFITEITDDLKKHGTVLIEKKMTLICIIGDLENNKLLSKVQDGIKDIPIRMISYGGSHNNLSLLVKTEDKIQVLRILNNNLFDN